MFKRRDFIPIICYASLFAVIVAWAALGPIAGDRVPTPHLTRAAMASGQLAPGHEELEVRFLAQRMLAR
jgi:hypothetical protein